MTEIEIYNEIKKIGGLDKIFISKKQLKEDLQISYQLVNTALEIYRHWVIANKGTKGYNHLQHTRKFEYFNEFIVAIDGTTDFMFVIKPIADEIKDIVAYIGKGGKYEKEIKLAQKNFYDLGDYVHTAEQANAIATYMPVAQFFNDNFGKFLEEA